LRLEQSNEEKGELEVREPEGELEEDDKDDMEDGEQEQHSVTEEGNGSVQKSGKQAVQSGDDPEDMFFFNESDGTLH